MYVYKYVNSVLSCAIAKKLVVNKNGKTFTNFIIDIGSTGNGLWKYYMRLGNSITKYIPEGEITHELKGDMYSIKPIKSNDGTVIKDNNGNIKYRIDSDDCPDAFKNDILLFIEIPNKNLENITYTIEGNATELAKAYVGKDRGEIISRSPAVVLEITGDFKLISTGTNKDGKTVQGCFSIKYGKGETVEYDYKETIKE